LPLRTGVLPPGLNRSYRPISLDPSALVIPSLEYWAEQKVLLRAGGYLPITRRPTAAVPQGVALRSEYGAAPFGVFAQIAIYLL
jgi:hypothetical protein